jgi:hypothetical protein
MGNTRDTRLSTTVVNAQANAQGALANGGLVDIYDGTRPANANTAVGSQVRLARLALAATAFATAVAGVITANAITADTSADASGNASWFRIFASNGTTPLWDGEVGTATADLILNRLDITSGANVSITSLTHTVPAQA